MRLLTHARCLKAATVTLLALSAQYVVAQEAADEQASAAEEAQHDAAVSAPPKRPIRKLYVSDKLVLNVYAAPGQAGERIATIETGDAVDELDRADDFTLVRTGDGREGWVGAQYLSAEPPAVLRMRELQRQHKAETASLERKAQEEIARLRKENTALAEELETVKANLAAATAAPAFADEGVVEGARDASPPEDKEASSGAVWIAFVAALAAGGAGFTAGYQTLARRIRKRFGGLRIY